MVSGLQSTVSSVKKYRRPETEDRSPGSALLGRLARPLLLRDLCARLARFRETDGDRLLAALHRLARAAALQLAALALVHRALDLLAGFLSVLGHAHPPLERPVCLIYAE